MIKKAKTFHSETQYNTQNNHKCYPNKSYNLTPPIDKAGS